MTICSLPFHKSLRRKAMKRIVLAVALLVAATTAHAQNFVHVRYTHKNGNANTFGGVWVQQDSTIGPIGAWGWVQSSPGYSETYGGPWIAPTQWSQVGVAYGQESATHPARYAGFLWVGNNHLSTFVSWEDGGTGKFLLNRSAHAVGKFHIGTWTDTGAGICPEVRFSPTKTITVWVARTVIGFRNTIPTTRIAMDYGF